MVYANAKIVQTLNMQYSLLSHSNVRLQVYVHFFSFSSLKTTKKAYLTHKNSLILLLHVSASLTSSSGSFTTKFKTYYNVTDYNIFTYDAVSQYSRSYCQP
jgi:hypothetical protein